MSLYLHTHGLFYNGGQGRPYCKVFQSFAGLSSSQSVGSEAEESCSTQQARAGIMQGSRADRVSPQVRLFPLRSRVP